MSNVGPQFHLEALRKIKPPTHLTDSMEFEDLRAIVERHIGPLSQQPNKHREASSEIRRRVDLARNTLAFYSAATPSNPAD